MYAYDPRQEVHLPANSQLPFIPPPDYSKTLKHPNSNRRPSLNNGFSPNNNNSTSPGSDPNLAVFVDFNKQDHIVNLTNGQMIAAEDFQKSPKTASKQVKLSQEERQEQRKNRVLKMLQTQGVPVFPGLTPSNPRLPSSKPQMAPLNASTPTSAPGNNNFPPQIDANANFGITKAYIKHLENHRKFDTLHSFQSCENCPICKQMISEIDVVLVQQKQQRTNGTNRNHHHQSLITNGKAFEPLTVLEEDEPDEFADELITRSVPPPVAAPDGYTYIGNDNNYPSTSSKNGSLESRRRYNNTNGYGGHQRESSVGSEPTDDIITARARDDWHAEHPNELTIKYGETLRVLKMGQDFVCCQNAHNEKGWVPLNFIYFMPA